MKSQGSSASSIPDVSTHVVDSLNKIFEEYGVVFSSLTIKTLRPTDQAVRAAVDKAALEMTTATVARQAVTIVKLQTPAIPTGRGLFLL